jgi:hypothetical protein
LQHPYCAREYRGMRGLEPALGTHAQPRR